MYDELKEPSLFLDRSDFVVAFIGEPLLPLLLLLLKMDDRTNFLMLNFDFSLLLFDCLDGEDDDDESPPPSPLLAGPKSNWTRLL